MRIQIIHKIVSSTTIQCATYITLGIRYLTIRPEQLVRSGDRISASGMERCRWIEAERDIGIHKHVQGCADDKTFIFAGTVEKNWSCYYWMISGCIFG